MRDARLTLVAAVAALLALPAGGAPDSRPERPLAGPLLEIRQPDGGQEGSPASQGGVGARLPPAADLRELAVTLEEVPRHGGGPEPVLAFHVTTAEGAGIFPAGLRIDLALAFGSPSPEAGAAHQVLSATLEPPAQAGQRRRRAGPEAPAVLRFSGLEGLGEMGSMEPGRRITFRVPLRQLLDGATSTQRETARSAEGVWQLSVWAESHLGESGDRLPAAGSAQLTVPEPAEP